jgi:hypothetical protein
MTDATSGGGIAYSSRALETTPGFYWGRVARFFSFCVALHRLWLGLFMVFSATLNNISALEE